MSISGIPVPAGLSNQEFIDFTKEILAGSITEESYDKPGYEGTMNVNLRRFDGWQDRLTLNEDLVEAIKAGDGAMKWILINEPWCLDGSFVQPLLQKLVDASEGKLTMRVLLRDRHPEIMDMFLSNGGRAIPKLIALDGGNEVLFTWGPRPSDLQSIISEIVRDPGYDPNEKIKKGTRWYIKDKGRIIQSELLDIITKLPRV